MRESAFSSGATTNPVYFPMLLRETQAGFYRGFRMGLARWEKTLNNTEMEIRIKWVGPFRVLPWESLVIHPKP